MWFAFTQPPYGTLDAAEWAPSTASLADICSVKRHVRFNPKSGHFRLHRKVDFETTDEIFWLAIKNHNSTQILTSLQVGISAIYFIKAISLRDQFPQFQHAFPIER
jgi:hypothetical protein